MLRMLFIPFISKAVAQENDWCDHLSKIISEGNDDTASGKADLHVSWAAYHSRRQEQAANPVHGPSAVTALLPLFPNNSKSVAMIRRTMNVVKKAVTVVIKSWANSSDRLWSATVQNCQTNPIDVARRIWREVFCYNVWQSTHQDGIAKSAWRSFGW